MEQGISALGLFTRVGLAWLLSANRWRVRPRIVLGGLALQFGLALLVLRTAPGRWLFAGIGELFAALLNFVDAGSTLVFGPDFANYYFAFKVLPTIIFFSSLMSILYYLGVMQRLVAAFAWVMQHTLGTSGAESLSAAANIFVGQTEAPLVVKPYVDLMTRSELMAVMVGGFATISGGVLAAYVGLGIDAGHLVTASVISAPAALMIAKVLQPEVDQPQTLGRVHVAVRSPATNLIEAATIGASDGLKLALNVAAMLLAFLALIAMCDALLQFVGARLGFNWSLALLLGYAFAPLAWLIGVEWADCLRVGERLGLRMVANEFIAYERMGQWLAPDSGVALSPRSKMLLTYALSGFANFGSIGIQVGGIGGLAPGRRTDLAQIGFRAMLGGTLACFMTACVAGILVPA